MDPANHAPGGLVGLRRADRHRQALARHQLDIAEVERGQLRAAGQQGEAEQHDGPVAQTRRRLGVAGRHDRGQVRGHDRHRLARPVPAVPRGLPALRGDHDLPRRQAVGRHRAGASVHRPDRGHVRVDAGRLQPSFRGQVGEVGRHGLRGRRQRDPARRRAPRLERAPARAVGKRRVLRHRLRDQRRGRVRHLEVGVPVTGGRFGSLGDLIRCRRVRVQRPISQSRPVAMSQSRY